MKLRYLSSLLLFFIFVQHSSEQGFTFNPANPNQSANNGNSGLNPGLVNTIRNTTSSLLNRLEGPRDRVIEFIKPAVKSDFSRNVTNVLNSIWKRVQASNSSLIQNPVVRNSIVRPLDTTLQRLKQITANENEHAEITDSNLEIINLAAPLDKDENTMNEEHEYMETNADTSVSHEILNDSPLILILDDEQLKEAIEKYNEQHQQLNNSNDQLTEMSNNDEVNGNEFNNKPEHIINDDKLTILVDEETASKLNEQQQQQDNTANELVREKKNSRSPRFLDTYTVVTPNRVRNLFDNVQQNGMQDCFALAVCEANCRPHLYEPYGASAGFGGIGGIGGRRSNLFSRLFDRVESFDNLDHPDLEYYSNARRYGQQFYDGGMSNDCAMCNQRYYCPHERDHLMNRFSSFY